MMPPNVPRGMIGFAAALCALCAQATEMDSPYLDNLIQRESQPASLDSPDSLSRAIEAVLSSLAPSVELLAFGEALHGGEEILILRNRLFQHLAVEHGSSAIAIESSFPRSQVVNEYVHGRGPATFDDVKALGFGHGMGDLEANRELVEWMREYNAKPEHRVKLSFYGFDIPSGTAGIASPSTVLTHAVDYLASIDAATAESYRARVAAHVGTDARWENPAVYMVPSASIALSPDAVALRIDIEDLMMEFRSRRPELVASSDARSYRTALHSLRMGRELLNFHVAMAVRRPGQSPAKVLGTRDALMADNLMHIKSLEPGTVFVFAHNSHLQRGLASWPGQKYWGTDDDCQWWPAGSLLAEMMSDRYAVIATAVVTSDENGIGEPDPGSLEARLATSPGPIRFVPLHTGDRRPEQSLRSLPVRSGSTRNPTYVPLDADCVTNFDWLAVFDSVTYNRGGPPLETWEKPEPDSSDTAKPSGEGQDGHRH